MTEVEQLILARLDEIKSDLGKRLENHDQRIDTLERWRAYLLGAWAAAAIGAVLAFEGLKAWVVKHFGG